MWIQTLRTILGMHKKTVSFFYLVEPSYYPNKMELTPIFIEL